MGNSQSNSTDSTEMNTRGRILSGAIGLIPGGQILVPLFEKLSSRMGTFRRKPNKDNDSVTENMRAREEAARKTQQEQESARSQKDARIAELESQVESIIKFANLALADRVEAVAKVRELEARGKDSASNRVRDEAELAELRKKVDEKDKELKKAEDKAMKLGREVESVRGVRRILSKEEEEAAKKRIKYNPEKLHFAICGPSGSGKSSLINAFRGLEVDEEGAAPVGQVETTKTITRYPDLRTVEHYSRFVWYDIPGAGTMSVKAKDYFENQALYVFDFVIVVYDGRFTEIALNIIDECIRFKIPMFVVRSKSDSQIDNMMKSKFRKIADMDKNDPLYQQTYEALKSEYVKDTERDFTMQIKALSGAGDVDTNVRLVLPFLRVFNVSAFNILAIVQNASGKTGCEIKESKLIHEFELIDTLMRAAMSRRYPDNKEAQKTLGASNPVFTRELDSGASSSAY